MKKYIAIIALCFISICKADAKVLAEYKDEINYSIFPLQDQVRYYNKEINFPSDFEENLAKGAFAIYNLRMNKNKLEYNFVGNKKKFCEEECFFNGVYFGKFEAVINCGGQMYEDGHERNGEFILERQECRDVNNKVIWARNLGDKQVFDENGNLLYYQDYNSVTTYSSGIINRQIIYSENEFKLYDKEDSEAFFHVKYERDDEGRIIKETHFNQDGFPYNIYEAQYVGEDCRRIIKIDSYTGKESVYDFNLSATDEDGAEDTLENNDEDEEIDE